METETERKRRGRLLPPRQLKAMRGTAVGSFLFGSVNPHAAHTHIFIQLLRRKARALLGGVMMEGNYGDTSPTPRSSPNTLDLLFFSCFVARLPILPPCTPARFPQGCPTIKWLPDPFACSGGWGRCTGRMHWVCGQWSHGERRRGGRLYFGIGYRGPFSFFPLLPVVLWPTYR